jgi:hypothetical protein
MFSRVMHIRAMARPSPAIKPAGLFLWWCATRARRNFRAKPIWNCPLWVKGGKARIVHFMSGFDSIADLSHGP